MIEVVHRRGGDSPSFWLLGILWSVVVDGEETGGRFSLMEQLMPLDSGPPPHIHPFNDEWFYVLEGEMHMTAAQEEVKATAGTSVWIPRGTVHSFRVKSETCRVLNIFNPAGMEQVVKTLGKPATTKTLPPKDMTDDPQTLAIFANNYWGMEATVPFARTNLTR